MKQNIFLEDYSKFLQEFLKPQKKLKVVFDSSNGVTSLVLKKLKARNLKFEIINGKLDGDFPAHGPNPLNPGATDQLQAAVKKNKADLGAVFDADGDRAFFVDDKGRLIDPDAIARLLIWNLKPEKIIVDSSSGWLVKKLIAGNLKIIPCQVGHYFIKKLMREQKADLGAERSGHYYFSFRNFGEDGFYMDSGILAAIEVINAVSKLPYRLSDFVDLLPRYYRSEIDINVGHIKDKEHLLKKIEDDYSKIGLADKSYLDGLTMEFSDWWFNIRFSQTEPLVRLNIEALAEAKLQEEVSKLKNYLN